VYERRRFVRFLNLRANSENGCIEKRM